MLAPLERAIGGGTESAHISWMRITIAHGLARATWSRSACLSTHHDGQIGKRGECVCAHLVFSTLCARNTAFVETLDNIERGKDLETDVCQSSRNLKGELNVVWGERDSSNELRRSPYTAGHGQQDGNCKEVLPVRTALHTSCFRTSPSHPCNWTRRRHQSGARTRGLGTPHIEQPVSSSGESMTGKIVAHRERHIRVVHARRQY
ncbi:hypothetical protein C8R47DRAFT_475177 [Mycena vitilis]|nr:hypothetical protein C8R47DRAFT_475177 [Mycena vitilis]